MDLKADWFYKTMIHNVKALKGIKVEKEHGDARRSICNECNKRQNGVFSDVCGLCNCPLSIKPYFLNHILAAVNITVERDEKERTRVICPHPEGNKWELIDEKFLKL